MAAKFIAEVVARTECSTDPRRFEITFADTRGEMQVVSVTAATARALSSVLEEFAASSRCEGPVPTKMPAHFAVGAARYEPLVLVRFEDDVPYGLEASVAARLGQALVDQAEIILCKPTALCQ